MDMSVMDYLDEHHVDTILEFGHGFKSILVERYGATRQVWDVDDWQGLSYFPSDRDRWERRFDEEVRRKAPTCTFRRGRLGGNNASPSASPASAWAAQHRSEEGQADRRYCDPPCRQRAYRIWKRRAGRAARPGIRLRSRHSRPSEPFGAHDSALTRT
jgi:hypothetical protein